MSAFSMLSKYCCVGEGGLICWNIAWYNLPCQSSFYYHMLSTYCSVGEGAGGRKVLNFRYITYHVSLFPLSTYCFVGGRKHVQPQCTRLSMSTFHLLSALCLVGGAIREVLKPQVRQLTMTTLLFLLAYCLVGEGGTVNVWTVIFITYHVNLPLLSVYCPVRGVKC